MPRVRKVPLPPATLLGMAFPHTDYRDAYRGEFRAPRPLGPEEACKAFFASAPGWLSALLALRNRLVRRLGLKAPEMPSAAERAALLRNLKVEAGTRVGLFQVFAKSPREVLMGENDRHLDFRVSILLEPAGPSDRFALTVATAVRFRRPLGKVYFALVRPFHALVVPALMRAMMRNLARAGRTGASGD